MDLRHRIKQIIFKNISESTNWTDEALVLKRTPEDNKIAIQSDLSGEREASSETFKNKEKIKKQIFLNGTLSIMHGQLQMQILNRHNF